MEATTTFPDWISQEAGKVAAASPSCGRVLGTKRPLPLFRVSGDWAGGGFAVTMPFHDAAAAQAWGLAKAGGRPDAVVTAELRATPEQQLQRLAADTRDGYGSYGRSCCLCGGTPSGGSHRGFVGTCGCGVKS